MLFFPVHRMLEGTKHVEISPPAMFINVVVGKDIGTELTLQNVTDKPVSFKVKTTAPDRYQVRPIQGLIAPHEKVVCFIVMKSMEQLPNFDNPKEVKHKFLVQTVQLPEGAKIDDLQAFWKETELKQRENGGSGYYLDQRISCKLRLPPANASSAPAAAPKSENNAVEANDYEGLMNFSTEQNKRINELTVWKEQLVEELKTVNQAKSQLETRLAALQRENTAILNSKKNGGMFNMVKIYFMML